MDADVAQALSHDPSFIHKRSNAYHRYSILRYCQRVTTVFDKSMIYVQQMHIRDASNTRRTSWHTLRQRPFSTYCNTPYYFSDIILTYPYHEVGGYYHIGSHTNSTSHPRDAVGRVLILDEVDALVIDEEPNEPSGDQGDGCRLVWVSPSPLKQYVS